MAFSAPEPDDARRAADADLTEPDPAAVTAPTLPPPAAGPVTAGPVPAGPLSTGPVVPEQPRSPLLAALGAGDAAVAAVARAFADAFSAATATQRTVQQRVTDLPAELEGLRGRFPSEELRRALESYRVQVERVYAGVRRARRGGVGAPARAAARPSGDHDAGVVHGQARRARRRAGRGGAGRRRPGRCRGRAAEPRGRGAGRGGGRAGERPGRRDGRRRERRRRTPSRTPGPPTAGAIEDAGGETAAVTRKASRGAGRAVDAAADPAPRGPGVGVIVTRGGMTPLGPRT